MGRKTIEKIKKNGNEDRKKNRQSTKLEGNGKKCWERKETDDEKERRREKKRKGKQ